MFENWEIMANGWHEILGKVLSRIIGNFKLPYVMMSEKIRSEKESMQLTVGRDN